MMAKRIRKEAVIKRFERANIRQKKGILLNPDIDFLEKDDWFNILEKFKFIDIETDDKGEKYEVLDMVMHEIQCRYGVKFSLSEIAYNLLYKDERKHILEIFDASVYPYKKQYFDEDVVRRRFWERRLYFELFEGYVMSVELLCNTSNSEVFYNNLDRLKNFPSLKDLNLLFFCGFKYARIKRILRKMNSIENIKVYEFFGDGSEPSNRQYWRLDSKDNFP